MVQVNSGEKQEETNTLRDRIEDVQGAAKEIMIQIREAREAGDLRRVRTALEQSLLTGSESTDTTVGEDDTAVADVRRKLRADVERAYEKSLAFFRVQEAVRDIFMREIVPSIPSDGEKKAEKALSFFDARMRNFRRVFLNDPSEDVMVFLRDHLDTGIDEYIIRAVVGLPRTTEDPVGSRRDDGPMEGAGDAANEPRVDDSNNIHEDKIVERSEPIQRLDGNAFAQRMQERMERLRREREEVVDPDRQKRTVTEDDIKRLEGALALAKEALDKETVLHESLAKKDVQLKEMLREFGDPPNEDTALAQDLTETKRRLDEADQAYRGALEELHRSEETYKSEGEAIDRSERLAMKVEKEKVFIPKVAAAKSLEEFFDVIREIGTVAINEKRDGITEAEGQGNLGEAAKILESDDLINAISSVKETLAMNYMDGQGFDSKHAAAFVPDAGYGIKERAIRLIEKAVTKEFDEEVVAAAREVREIRRRLDEGRANPSATTRAEVERLGAMMEDLKKRFGDDVKYYSRSLEHDYLRLVEDLRRLEDVRSGGSLEENRVSLVAVDAPSFDDQIGEKSRRIQGIEAKRDTLFKYAESIEPGLVGEVSQSQSEEFVRGSYAEELLFTHRIRALRTLEELQGFLRETFTEGRNIGGIRTERSFKEYTGEEVARMIDTQSRLIEAFVSGTLPEGELKRDFDPESVARLIPDRFGLRQKFRELVGVVSTPEVDRERERLIRNVQTLDDLIDTVGTFRFIRGVADERALYTGSGMSWRIRRSVFQLRNSDVRLRPGEAGLEDVVARVTRRHGIRERFRELVGQEIFHRGAKYERNRSIIERIKGGLDMQRAVVDQDAKKRGLLERMKSATKGIMSFLWKKDSGVTGGSSRSDGEYQGRIGERGVEKTDSAEKGAFFSVRSESNATVADLLKLAFHRSELMKFPQVASDPEAMANLFANKYFNDHKNDPVLGSREIVAREIGITVTPQGEIEVQLMEVNPSMIIRNTLRHVLGTESGMTSLTDKRIASLPFEVASRLRTLARDRGVECGDEMYAGAVIASLIEKYGGRKINRGPV